MVLRIQTVRKCSVNLHGECFCPDLSEMNLSSQTFSDAGSHKGGMMRDPHGLILFSPLK